MAAKQTSRRGLLQAAAGLAGGVALAKGAAASGTEGAPLPKVKIGKHEVTRLIIGSNPLYGYSHFNRLLDAHMKEWMTPDRVSEILHTCEKAGINTWQFHYMDRSIEDLKRHRDEGGNLQFFLLHDFQMRKDWSLITKVAKAGPIGIAHHGGVTDDLFRSGQIEKVHDFVKAVKDAGVMAGISTHNPSVIDYVEGKDWGVDYYMTCLYHISRNREEVMGLLNGKVPLGESFIEDDPVHMTRMVKQTKKTCLAFKLLAAGRNINSPEELEKAFEFAFKNIKDQDCVIVGMYPRYKDEVRDNAERVRRICSKLA